MRTKAAKISDVLTQIRAGKTKPNVTLATFGDQFILDQVILKLSAEFQVSQFGDDLESFRAVKKGLFKPGVAIVDFTPEIIEHLRTRLPAIPTLIVVKEDQLKEEAPSTVYKLASHSVEDMTAAFVAWSSKRGFVVDPAAVAFGLENMTPDDLKRQLEYLALRDDNFVSLPAIQKEFEEFEGNVFQLMDSLLFGNRWNSEQELMLLLQTNAPHRILATLTTLTKTMLEALQGKKAGANANQVAERVDKKYGTVKAAFDKINSMHFNEVRLVLMYNMLIGLTLQLRRSSAELNSNETMRLAVLQYMVNCGYAGN